MIRECLDLPGTLPQRRYQFIIRSIRAPVGVAHKQLFQRLTRSEGAAIGSSVGLRRWCVSGAVGHD